MNIAKLRLRDDEIDQVDEIDLDDLTPKARTLAEQILRSDLHSRTTVWYAHENGDRIPWSGWSPYPAASTTHPRRYLEAQAAKAPESWRLIPVAHDQSVREAHLRMLKTDLERAEEAFRIAVVREASGPRSEAPVAREAGLDRMTIRSWLGKR
jgi:hypothetical protein